MRLSISILSVKTELKRLELGTELLKSDVYLKN